MHMPHSRREQLYPEAGSSTTFPYVRCLLGFLHYLLHLTLNADGTIRIGSSDHYAAPSSYPLPLPIISGSTEMFRTSADALDYIDDLLCHELKIRSMLRDLIASAKYRLRASYVLARGVVAPDDRALWNKTASGTIKRSPCPRIS